MKNVLEWLEASVAKNPDDTVYLDTNGKITFHEVEEKAKALGTALAERGLSAKPIAVITGRTVQTPVVFLGVVYSGRAYAPIDAHLPPHRIAKIMRTLEPEIILTDQKNQALACEIAAMSIEDGLQIEVYVAEELMKQKADQNLLDRIRRGANLTDPLYLIFTSGSTGNPKGVITSHQSLICYIQAYAGVMEIEKKDRLGNQSPLDYIAAIRDIYLPLMTGCSALILPKEYFMEPDRLFQCMNQYGVTAVGWSVSAFTILLSLGAFSGEQQPDTLRKVCFSGSVMPCKCLKVWQQHLPKAKFVNQYGPTEATASCTYYEVDHEVTEEEVLPIGVPYENYRISLIKEDGTEAGIGEEGEICVSGPILALGYYRDPVRTAESFVQNPLHSDYPERIYKTGDIGVRRADGMLEFHGRKDRQIKHMGHRVELDEVEVAAGQVGGVDLSCCLYRKEKEALYLFYEGCADRKQVILEMRTMLPGFMVPRKVIQLEKIPKLPNGKIDMLSLKNKMK